MNSTNLTQEQTIYFKVKVKVQPFTELSHSRLSSCGVTGIREALEMGNNPCLLLDLLVMFLSLQHSSMAGRLQQQGWAIPLFNLPSDHTKDIENRLEKTKPKYSTFSFLHVKT